MRIIVVGAGEVGYDVARMLATEQHDVVVIDVDEAAIDFVRDKLDVMTLVGNATSAQLLDRAGIRQTDLLVAVTAVDEVNIIACMMADRLGVPTTVARVRSAELARSGAVLEAGDFGIDLIIHPEETAAEEIIRLVRRASATDVLTFADGRLQLVGMRLDRDSPVVGQSLRDLVASRTDITFRVMGIVRGIRTIIPTGDEVLRPNDQVFVLVRPKEWPHVARLLGKSEGKIQEIMILGGNKVGARVAAQLGSEKRKHIKLIEPRRDVAEALAEQLRDVLVICGDPTDLDLMAREGLGEMDAFISVTQDEESNLVSCLMAKHLGVQKTVALLSKGAYIPISQSIGLDAAVSVKLAVSREILRFLRGKNVQSVATVHGLDAEILEIEAGRRARITQAPLMETKLPRGVLIGAVQRGRDVEIATGRTHIQPGDQAIVFVRPRQVGDVERLFAR